jgi:hypothetical protein
MLVVSMAHLYHTPLRLSNVKTAKELPVRAVLDNHRPLIDRFSIVVNL